MNKLIILILFIFFKNLAVSQSKKNSFQPDISTKTNKVVYVSDKEGRMHIFTCDLKGAGNKKITEDGFNVMPNFSPSGNEIAFIKRINENFQIFKMNEDGSNVIQLTNNSGNNFAPKWSPDGKFIAFASNKDGDSEIYVISKDGDNEVKLTNNFIDDDRPEWSLDGNSIIYNHKTPDGWNLYEMNIDNKIVNKLFTEDASSPALSPNGKFILYESKLNNSYGLFMFEVETDKITKFIVESGIQYANSEWAENGEYIVYQSNKTGNNEVYIFNTNDKESKQLTFSN